MKCVLRIGFSSFLLPDHKGVEKIIDMLSKGMECDTYFGRGDEVTVRGPVEIGVSLVPDSTKIKATPEFEEELEKSAQPKRPGRQKALPARTLHLIDHKKGR